MSKAVAIIGMGCRFPGSPDLNRYWSSIREARVCSRPVPRERWNHDSFFDANPRLFDKTYARKLASLDDIYHFAPEFFGLLPRRARLMDPQQRVFLDVARMAIEDAGYGAGFPERNTGVYLGISVSEHHSLAGMRLNSWQLRDADFGRVPEGFGSAWEYMVENVPQVQGYSMIGQMLNMAAANVNQAFDLQGPSFATDAACSSSLVALTEAILHLRAGFCDAALVGGVYLALKPDNMVAFSRIGALSPSDECRPFDERADGFVLGEGAGAVLLKRLDDARRDGDRIWAVIRGIGLNSDGHAEGPMTPRLGGQVEVLRRAYRDAGVSPDTVQLIEAHGTGTRVGDATEASSLKQCLTELGVGPAQARLSAVKATIGHTLAAAGVAGLIKAGLALAHRTIPPMAGCEKPRDLGLGEVGVTLPTSAEAWPERAGHPRRASVSSFGFGGTNVHAVLEEAPEASAPRHWVPVGPKVKQAPELFVLSSPTVALLVEEARRLRTALLEEIDLPLADIAYTLARRRLESERVAFCASSRQELLDKLERAASGSASDDDIWRGRAPGRDAQPARAAWLFPGQGAQTVDLCRDLFDRFPVFRAAVERLSAERPLLSHLYPAPGADRAAAQSALTRTEVCQPALAVLELALVELAASIGLVPDLMIGHSLGELVAGAAAGVLPPDVLVELVAARGKLMADLDLPDGGAMAAVAADRAAAARIIADIPGVAVANFNHPRQVVISGARAAVAEAQRRLEAADVKVTPLVVSHAFHSPMVGGMTAAFEKLLAGFELAAPARELISCIEPKSYPSDAAEVRALWARHATAPVDFEAAVRLAWQGGARVFVQVGGGTHLLSMVRATLRDEAEPLTTVPLADDGSEGLSFLSAIGRLCCAGASLRLAGLFDGRDVSLCSLPPQLLETRHFWLLRPPTRLEKLPSFVEGGGQGAEPPPPSGGAADTGTAPRSADKPPADAPGEGGGGFGERLARLAREIEALQREYERGNGNGVSSRVVAVPSPSSSPSSSSSPSPSPSPSNGATDVSTAVMAALAKVTAIPRERIDVKARLVADLGFDSLMAVELTAALMDALPGLRELPPSLLANDLTISELIDHTGRAMRAAAVPAGQTTDATSAAPTVFAPRWEMREIAPFAGDELPFAGNVMIVDDGAGVASELAQLLDERGRPTMIVPADSAPNGEARDVGLIIDLRALHGPSERTPSAAALREEALETLGWIRRASYYGAGYVSVSRNGAATAAGIPALVRALAREWPQRLLKSLEFDGLPGADAAAVAARIADEISSTDREVELRFAGGERRVARVEAIEPAIAALPKGAVVAITGASSGLGAALARHLAREYGARLLLLGRRPASEVSALIAEITELGGHAVYASSDVTDADAVARALLGGRAELGAVQYAVHCAGVTADGTLDKSTDEEFSAVFDTKVAGALALWRALAADPLRGFAVYGSWAGRFGNAHQTSYAAANRALAVTAERLRAERPEVRVVALDLPPWEGGGMVDRLPEAVRQQMRARGVPFLRDESALPLVAAELAAAPKRDVQLVVGVGQPPARREDLAVFHLDAAQPLLDDHRIAGSPVLPMAAALDLAIDAARRVGVSAPPGGFLSVSDFEVVNGAALREGHGILLVRAGRDEHDENSVATIEIDFADGRSDRRVLAYRGRVQPGTGAVPRLARASGGSQPPLSLEEFYRRYTFHGPRLRGITRVADLGDTHIRGSVRSAESGTLPHRQVDVLAVDAAFQLCGYWARAWRQRGALPRRIGECLVLAPIGPGQELTCLATLGSIDDGRLTGDLELSADGRPLLLLRGVEADLFEQWEVNNDDTTAVSSETFRIEEFPEVKELRARMAMAEAFGLKNPYFHVQERVTNETSTIGGVEYVNFASYNYLGLSGHPDVTRAAAQAVERYGTSVSASRVASGERPLHRQLEGAIAAFLGCEDAVVMVGGHATNVSVIGHMFGPEDVIVHDSLAHDSILGGARLSGARRRPFAHNDPAALQKVLEQVRPNARRVLIAVEGVYSMDGDIAPLPEIIALKKKHGALLLVDEAHSLGVLGVTGRGIGEHFPCDRADVDMWMGTLSKSLASCGGYIAGSAALVEYLKYTNPGFVYSVGISPANAGAALAALHKLENEPERVTLLHARSRLLLELFLERGIDTGLAQGSGVVPCIVRNSLDCLQLSESLRRRCINVQPILYPAVEENLARLRFFVTARHTEEQLIATADAVREELARINPKHLLEPRARAGAPWVSGERRAL